MIRHMSSLKTKPSRIACVTFLPTDVNFPYRSATHGLSGKGLDRGS